MSPYLRKSEMARILENLRGIKEDSRNLKDAQNRAGKAKEYVEELNKRTK